MSVRSHRSPVRVWALSMYISGYIQPEPCRCVVHPRNTEHTLLFFFSF